MKSGSHTRLASTLAVLAALGTSSVAGADTDPQARAKAEALFSEAMQLSSRGEHAKACETLEEAVRLTEREAVGGILELARCKEKIGKTASAWALYREVMAKAARGGQPEREREATRAANELEPRLHRLQLSLDPELARTKGLSIRQGSIELGRAAWTLSTPVDPGELEIEARAPGKRSITRTVEIPSGPGTTRLSLPTFDEDEAPVPTAEPREDESPTPAGSAGGWSGTRVAGVVVAGAGVATMAVSSFLILAAKSDWDAAHSSECDGDVCSRKGKDQIDAARDKGTIATVVFGAGAALTITGAVLFLAAPSSSRESARRPTLGVSAAAWSRGGGVSLGGRF